VYTVTDSDARIRTPPDEFKNTGRTIPVGSQVEVLESAEKNGKRYSLAQQVMPEGVYGPPMVWGWTLRSNLSGTSRGSAPAAEQPAADVPAAPETPSGTDTPVPTVAEGEIEKTIRDLNQPATNAIMTELSNLASTKQVIDKKKEETGTGREELVAQIEKMRDKIGALDAGTLNTDATHLRAIRAYLYRRLARLAPYYTQGANVNILSGNGKDAYARTCNITSISMTLEGLGVTSEDFRGDMTLLNNIMQRYEGKLEKYQEGGIDAHELRLPDFLQLVAIYIKIISKSSPQELNQLAQSDAAKFAQAVDKARTQAAGMITNNQAFDDFTTLFGARAEIVYLSALDDVLSAFGAATRTPEKREEFIANSTKWVEDAKKELETLQSQNASAKAIKKAEKNLANKQKLEKAYKAAGDDAAMEEVLPVAKYRDAVLPKVNDILGSGKQVVVSLHNHFVRLEALSHDNIVVDDPGSITKKNKVMTWAEARSLGYFKRYTVISKS
jgi:hypothetical protein